MDWIMLKQAYKTPVAIRFGTVRNDPRGPQARSIGLKP
jgi:hypothetical protein